MQYQDLYFAGQSNGTPRRPKRGYEWLQEGRVDASDVSKEEGTGRGPEVVKQPALGEIRFDIDAC